MDSVPTMLAIDGLTVNKLEGLLWLFIPINNNNDSLYFLFGST